MEIDFNATVETFVCERIINNVQLLVSSIPGTLHTISSFKEDLRLVCYGLWKLVGD